MRKDLKSKKLIYLKAILFIIILFLSVILNIIEDRVFFRVFSLVLAIWSSARLYYFAFYVIEHYVDADFKFSGIFDFLVYLFRRKKS